MSKQFFSLFIILLRFFSPVRFEDFVSVYLFLNLSVLIEGNFKCYKDYITTLLSTNITHQIRNMGSANYPYMPKSQACSSQNWNCWENLNYEIKQN